MEGGGSGPRKTVVIDKLKFVKKKHHRAWVTDGQLVFGDLCHETNEYFAVEVDKRDTDYCKL